MYHRRIPHTHETQVTAINTLYYWIFPRRYRRHPRFRLNSVTNNLLSDIRNSAGKYPVWGVRTFHVSDCASAFATTRSSQEIRRSQMEHSLLLEHSSKPLRVNRRNLRNQRDRHVLPWVAYDSEFHDVNPRRSHGDQRRSLVLDKPMQENQNAVCRMHVLHNIS